MENKVEVSFIQLIELYASMKNYGKALHFCNKALAENRLDVDLLYTKAMLLYKNHKFNETLKMLEVVKKYDLDKVYFKDAEVLYYSCISMLI